MLLQLISPLDSPLGLPFFTAWPVILWLSIGLSVVVVTFSGLLGPVRDPLSVSRTEAWTASWCRFYCVRSTFHVLDYMYTAPTTRMYVACCTDTNSTAVAYDDDGEHDEDLINGFFFNSMMDVFAGQFQAWTTMTERYNELEPRYAAPGCKCICFQESKKKERSLTNAMLTQMLMHIRYPLFSPQPLEDGGVIVLLTSLQELCIQTPLGLILFFLIWTGNPYRLGCEIVFNCWSIAGVWYFYLSEPFLGFPLVHAPFDKSGQLDMEKVSLLLRPNLSQCPHKPITSP